MLHAEGGQLRAQHRYRDLAVEHVEPGSYRPATSLAIPLDDLADFEGSKDSPVVLEAAAPDRTVVRWEDRAIPQSREYDVTPVDRVGQVPELPASWSSSPAELLTALADATETGIPDSTRYALHCVQLQGSRNQIVATDGRQLLVRTGFRFPWPGDLLIKGSPIFACRALPRDQPVEVGKTDTHVVLRVGPWTIWLEIQKEVRFPDVERVIPQPGEVLTRLRVDPEDARFLESSLARLPGGDELNSPVTVDLNGKIAVRANAPDQPQQVTELVLSRSSYTGSPVCIATNRVFLDRALRLGFTEIGFSGVESPFVCRDQKTVYAVQPLSGGSSPGPERERDPHRIERGHRRGEPCPDPSRDPEETHERTRRTQWPRAGEAGRDQLPHVGEAGGDQRHRRHRAAGHQPGGPDPGGRGPARDARRREVTDRPPDLGPAAPPQAVAAGQRDAEVAPRAEAPGRRRLTRQPVGEPPTFADIGETSHRPVRS